MNFRNPNSEARKKIKSECRKPGAAEPQPKNYDKIMNGKIIFSAPADLPKAQQHPVSSGAVPPLFCYP
jgi:hypothetical protein